MKKFKIILQLILFTSFLSSCGFEIVDDGYVGIKKSLGKVEMQEYEPGIHFYNPLTTGIFEMEIREQAWESKFSSYSSDNQIVDANFKVNYKPEKNKMAELYVNQGDEYINKILPQRVESAMKDVLGRYKATNMVQIREKINEEIRHIIREKLDGTNVQMVGFEITNFDYDDDFEKAVKAKIVAKERAVEEKNRTVQIEEQAKQKVISAKASAEEIRIKAQALSKNKDLIQLEAVKKWNGVLPTMSMGGALPFIQLPNTVKR